MHSARTRGATRSVILAGLLLGALAGVSRADELTLKSALKGHPALVYHVQFAPDGTLVSSSAWSAKGNNPDTVIAWSVPDGKKKKGLPLEQSITIFGLFSEGKQAAIGRGDHVGLFDLKTAKEGTKLQAPGMMGIASTAASDKANAVAAGFEKNDIVIWTVPAKGKKAAKPRVLSGHTKPAIRLAFSPDGKQLVSGSQDYSARLWDVSTGKSLHVLTPEKADSPVSAAKYSHDGKLVATTGTRLCFWDPETGEEKEEVLPEKACIGVRSIAFSPDDSLLAVSTINLKDTKKGMIEVWDLKSQEKLAEAADPDGMVYDVDFSPDGKLIAAGGGDTVKLWSLVREK